MKKKTVIIMTAVCLCLILTTTAVIAATTAKTTIVNFSTVSASIEKNYSMIIGMDLTYKDGKPVYKAKVIDNDKRVTVYYDATTGKQIEKNTGVSLDNEESELYTNYEYKSSNPNTSVTQTQKEKISENKAKEIAVEKVGGGTVREIELDSEKGVLVYEIEVKYNGVKYEVEIDAYTGEIVKFKKD